MLIKKLKEEYEMRHRIANYRKLFKNYLLNRFEKNNVNLIYKTMEEINTPPVIDGRKSQLKE